MVLIEKSFPRGGTTKSSVKNETKTKGTKNIVFGARQEKKQRKTRKQKPEDELQITENIEAISAELLTYKTIQEGMILMGYVEDIKTTHLKISLPGRMTGKIPVSSISYSYNKVLNDVIKNNSTSINIQNYTQLDGLFEIGQKVYTKVVKIHENIEMGRIDIELSVRPEDVHSDLTHENIKKGMIFNGAIEEIQEHGYVIETGIKNLRCFLPLEKLKVKNQKQHSIGQIICIKIDKLTKDKMASTGICKLTNSRKIKDLIDPRIEYILPTMIIHFTVTKILKDGLQGTIMNGNFTAYCNELYLCNKSVTMPTDYEVNSTYKAQILYVMPITKLVYVSLNLSNEDGNDDDQAVVAADDEKISLYKRGDVIVNAKVDRITTGGIILTLDKDHQSKGIISFKSIKSNLLANYDQDELLSKYYKNSKHRIRILGYCPLESLYLCTDNLSDVSEKYFTLNDLEIGEFVTATVEDKHKNPENGGYYVTIGKVRGFIEKIFLWPTTKNLSKSTKIHCRILAKDPERNIVYVTNRPEFMNKSTKMLKKSSDIKENRVYPGIVVKCGPQFFVVKFFNNIKGILHRTHDLKMNKFVSFYEGQIMNFCIASYDEDKLLLNLVEDSYKIGEIYSGIIDHIIPDVGLDVKLFKKEENSDNDGDDDNDNDDSSSKNLSLRALIPQQFITEFPELQQLRLQTFKIKDTLMELICLEKNLFSLRDVNYYKMNPSVLLWSNLKVGDVLRGVVRNILGNEILEIFIPVQNFNGTVKVHMNMMLMNLKNFNFVRFHEEQICYVKILSKTRIHKLKTLTVSGKLTDVWNGNLLETGKFFEKYLNELKIIRESMTESSICKLNIGQICSAKVLEYDEQNQYYKLAINDNDGGDDDDNEKGIGMIKLSTMQLLPSMKNKKLKVGSNVKCVVLWIDYVNEIVYLSPSSHELEKRIVEGVALPKNLIHKNSLMARILLITSNVIVCSLKKGSNPLVLIPKRLHYNDFENSAVLASVDDQQNDKNDDKVGIKEGEFCRLSIIHEKMSIGIFDNVWRFWNAAYKENRKRKISENEKSIKEPIASKKPKMIAKLNEDNETSVEVKEELMSTDDEANEDIKSEQESISEVETEDYLEFRSRKIKKLNEKRKEKNAKSVKLIEESISTDDEVNEDIKSEQESSSEAESEGNHLVKIKNCNETQLNNKNLSLPGLSNFWSTNNLESIARTSRSNEEISSSSSDNDEDDKDSSGNKKKQKKRLTAAEKFQMSREEEQRLREIEEKLAYPDQHPPETVDQFERLILSNPNDSKIWINYMVHHLQATEIDKAKQVGRKALKTISFREEQELLNIWIALLNLELLYGTKDTFNDVLKESLLCNDPYKVYMRVLRILVEAKKVQELCDVVGVCTKRFKDKPEMWKNAATAYFDVNLMDKGKQLLHRALKVLPEREHVNTIVTFANLNHKYGDKEISHALYEQILTSYPKRVDVWSQYIDILTKDQDFESARRTLDRAIVQKLPLKKMRTLFKKYLDFEEKYGTEENVLKVKEMAANYVQKEISVE